MRGHLVQAVTADSRRRGRRRGGGLGLVDHRAGRADAARAGPARADAEAAVRARRRVPRLLAWKTARAGADDPAAVERARASLAAQKRRLSGEVTGRLACGALRVEVGVCGGLPRLASGGERRVA